MVVKKFKNLLTTYLGLHVCMFTILNMAAWSIDISKNTFFPSNSISSKYVGPCLWNPSKFLSNNNPSKLTVPSIIYLNPNPNSNLKVTPRLTLVHKLIKNYLARPSPIGIVWLSPLQEFLVKSIHDWHLTLWKASLFRIDST